MICRWWLVNVPCFARAGHIYGWVAEEAVVNWLVETKFHVNTYIFWQQVMIFITDQVIDYTFSKTSIRRRSVTCSRITCMSTGSRFRFKLITMQILLLSSSLKGLWSSHRGVMLPLQWRIEILFCKCAMSFRTFLCFCC